MPNSYKNTAGRLNFYVDLSGQSLYIPTTGVLLSVDMTYENPDSFDDFISGYDLATPLTFGKMTVPLGNALAAEKALCDNSNAHSDGQRIRYIASKLAEVGMLDPGHVQLLNESE